MVVNIKVYSLTEVEKERMERQTGLSHFSLDVECKLTTYLLFHHKYTFNFLSPLPTVPALMTTFPQVFVVLLLFLIAIVFGYLLFQKVHSLRSPLKY